MTTLMLVLKSMKDLLTMRQIEVMSGFVGKDALVCMAAVGTHPLVIPVEELGPLLLLLPRLPVLVLCHLLTLLLIPPLLVEPAELHSLVGVSCYSIVPPYSMAQMLEEEMGMNMQPLWLAQHTC